MRELTAKEKGEIGEAFKGFFNSYPFTAIITISWERYIPLNREIPDSYDLNIEKLVDAIAVHCGEGVGCLGLLATSPSGGLHAHFMLAKATRQPFTTGELNWIARRQRANTMAEPIHGQTGIASYIADHYQLEQGTGRYLPLAYGLDTLKAIAKPLKRAQTR